MSSLLSQRFKEAFCSKQTVSAIKFVKLLTTGQLCSREFEQYELLDSDYLVVFLGCWGALLLKLENDNYNNNGVSDTNENISENINIKQHLYTHNLSIVLGLLQGCTEELAEVRKNSANSESENNYKDQKVVECKPFELYIDLIRKVALNKDLEEDHAYYLTSQINQNSLITLTSAVL